MLSVEHKMELLDKISGGATVDEIMDFVWETAIDECIAIVSRETHDGGLIDCLEALKECG